MCRRASCEKCGKTTWAGCGAHVDAVMAGVPAAQRCQCPRDQKKESGGLGSLLQLFGLKTGGK